MFPVIVTQVGYVDRKSGEHILRAFEVESAFLQSPFALDGIIGDPHMLT